jgi:hypothetical protein
MRIIPFTQTSEKIFTTNNSANVCIAPEWYLHPVEHHNRVIYFNLASSIKHQMLTIFSVYGLNEFRF